MTITDPTSAAKLLQDDTLPLAYAYVGLNSEPAWAFFEDTHYDDIASSPFVLLHYPLKKENELTEEGKAFYEKYSKQTTQDI